MQSENPPYQEQLVRGLAHKMNNILTLFHGYVGLMLDNRELDQTTRANLSKIKEGACAASELLDRTHALVRESDVLVRPLDVRLFIDLLLPAMKAACSPATQLDVTIAPGELDLVTDSGRLKIALLELVKNAGESTANNGGSVRVDVRPLNLTGSEDPLFNGSWISFCVTDDGPGITEQVAPRIFQPFFTTKRRKNSAGLGLNVASDAVQHLGGVLRHLRAPGETRFEILLPGQRA